MTIDGELGDLFVKPAAVEVPAGTSLTVRVVNKGAVPHDLKWNGTTGTELLKPGTSATADELIAPVAARKGSYQAPKSVDFVDAIPQTPVGKPDKKVLRAQYAQAVSA